VVYDLIDDWTAPSLGGDWYRPELESRLASEADVLVASAPDLVHRLDALSGRPATLVPNAVNTAVFSGEVGETPDDLADLGTPVIGYHGSLYGDWFDWHALADVAMAHPRGSVVVIGDEPVAHPAMPGNVRFLGLKPQTALPGYLARFDVGLVPFRVTDVTHAVSPLKAYEYLAMGVPVAAPPLRALAGLDGVHRDPDLVAATASALREGRIDGAAARRQHSWQARVATLCDAAGLAAPDSVSAAPRPLLRPALHHRGRDRAVRERP
jgi:O-antigen biosynthesis protein